MPFVDKEMSRQMRAHRAHCYKCGCFIGEGGYYDVMYDDYSGSYEEGYSTCRRHTKQKVLAESVLTEAAKEE